MNQILRFVCLATILSIFTVGVFAQKEDPKKVEDFNKIAKLYNSKKPEDKEKAYQDSKVFLTKYGKDDDEKTKKIKQLVHAVDLDKFDALIKAGKTDEAFLFGKEYLERNPDDLYVMMNLAYNGYEAFNKTKDDSFAGDSINFAKQSIKLMNEGKKPESFSPFKDQTEATALMYYVIGTFMVDIDPKESAMSFVKAVSFESQLKTNSSVFYQIANYYEKMYEESANNYKTKFSESTKETPEMKAEQQKLNNYLDRMIDAYARTVKLAETDKNPNYENWKNRLTQIYKFRNKSETGLTDLINTVLSKAMPEIL